MAAKQGLTAHLSQASEDAKRAVLQRTPLKSTWFSNLNTTCTIKSAPPRTPDVLDLLSTKSGFLYKRNEQHVWQARWCCVVPHTFLYYFDAVPDATVPGVTSAPPLPPPPSHLQEQWNEAITSSGRKTTAPRSSLNIFSTSTAAPTSTSTSTSTAVAADENVGGGLISGGSSLQPTGIIDLECYTSVHRSPANPRILELSGDDSVNPDLRSFYFCCDTPVAGDTWTQALLSGRHSALLDEREAYRQVCDGFALQLQDLHHQLDQMEKENSDKDEECYRIRSAQEEVRRQCTRFIQQALDRDAALSETPFAQARRAYRTDLETVRRQDMGLVPAVQLLCDYTSVLESSNSELHQKLIQQDERMQRAQDGDSRKTQEMDSLLKAKEHEWYAEKETMQNQIRRLEQHLSLSQKSLQDTHNDLSGQKMEFTMFQSATKSKIKEISGHKKILKKEVIDLRQKLDEVGSELNLLKHTSKTRRLEVEQERKKAELLERYVQKMESQVQVQQNMMEMMSQHGYENGSRASFGSRDIEFHQPPEYDQPAEQRSGMVLVDTPLSVHTAVGNDDDDDDDDPGETHSQLLRKVMDEDNKSHMSELTEDRTQRHLFEEDAHRKNARRPPSFIGIAEAPGHPTLDTIEARAAVSSPLPPRGTRLHTDDKSTASFSSKSRSQDIRSTPVTPVRVRIPPGARAKSTTSQSSSVNGGGGFFGTMAKSFTDAIDNSVLGLPVPEPQEETSSGSGEDDYSESCTGQQEHQQQQHHHHMENQDEHTQASVSEAGSSGTALSLAERQQIQRAQQIAFLKQQGLLKHKRSLTGGAGVTSPARR